MALSNMPIESVSEDGDEKECKFYQTPAMCSYLLCLCVGNFSSIESVSKSGIPIQYFTKSGNENQFKQYLEAAVFAMNWMETNFNIKYELPCLKLISLEGCPPGMENYGLITLPDYSKYLNYIQNLSVVIHEVIHQWFGSLVSIEYWNFLWLKEGFAQYIKYLILNDFLPESEAFRIFTFNDGMKCIEYFDSNRKIVPPESEIDFDNLFDSLVYSKGAFVVKMFHDLIEHENFTKVCSAFLNEFKYKLINLSDFISVVNSTLNDDYSNFFEIWLQKARFPVLTVREIAQNIGINIVQMKQGDYLHKFKVPIVYSKNGENKTTEVIISNYITQVNNNYSSHCFVVYSKKLLKCLLNAKNEDKISLQDRMISKAIKFECAPLLIDDEMIQIAEKFT